MQANTNYGLSVILDYDEASHAVVKASLFCVKKSQVNFEKKRADP